MQSHKLGPTVSKGFLSASKCLEEGTKGGEGLGQMSHEERLRTFGLFSLEKEAER